MEIISRKDAHFAKQNIYFTGKPCRNGHVTYRYVQSGTCAGCVRASAYRYRDDFRNVTPVSHAEKEAAQTARAKLIEMKVRVFECDWPTLRELAANLCLARLPALRPNDAVSSKAAMDRQAGTALYRVLSHPDDMQLIRDTADELLKAPKHRVDFTAGHQARLAASLALAEQAARAGDFGQMM